MRVNVDLTGERFSDLKLVSFYDSKTLFFQPPRELPSSLSFEVWGADIMPGFPWSEHLSAKDLKKLDSKLSESDGRLTVRGLGILSFEGLEGGSCSIEPRDPSNLEGENGSGFLTMANGEAYSLKREWPFDRGMDGLHCYAFEGADIEFPRSAGVIYLYGTGGVSFEFEVDDCLSSNEYWRTRGYLLEPKAEQDASISTPDPWRVEIIMTIQPLTQKSEPTLGQV